MADRKASRISKKPPEKWWSLVLDHQTVVFDKSSVLVAVPFCGDQLVSLNSKKWSSSCGPGSMASVSWAMGWPAGFAGAGGLGCFNCGLKFFSILTFVLMLMTSLSGSTCARRSELRLQLHSACLGLGWHTFHQAVRLCLGFASSTKGLN